MSETAGEPAEVVDPVTALQNTLSSLDRDAMCIGFSAVVEWLEADGSSSVEIIHTDMPPWHLAGLMEWGKKMSCGFYVASETYVLDDEDDE